MLRPPTPLNFQKAGSQTESHGGHGHAHGESGGGHGHSHDAPPVGGHGHSHNTPNSMQYPSNPINFIAPPPNGGMIPAPVPSIPSNNNNYQPKRLGPAAITFDDAAELPQANIQRSVGSQHEFLAPGLFPPSQNTTPVNLVKADYSEISSELRDQMENSMRGTMVKEEEINNQDSSYFYFFIVD